MRLASLVGLIVALAVPWLIDNQFVLLLIALCGITYIVALGLNLVMGFAGQVSLGHAALFGVGAYTSAILTLRHGLPFPLALLAAGSLTGAGGLLLGIPALRLSGAYLAMATMAFNIILQRLMVNWSALTGGPDGLSGIPPPGLGPLVLDRRTSLYLIALVAVLALLAARNLVRSRHGRALLAMRGDELAASCLGVNLYRAKLSAFALSAVYAGLAGSLFAHVVRHISPISFGLDASLELLLAVILAGPGTLVWPLVGAAFVTILPQLPALQSLQELRLFAYGALLLGTIVLLPSGLGGLGAARRARPDTPPAPGLTAEHAQAALTLDSPTDHPAPSKLTLTDVTRRFGGVVALDGVSLTIEPGSVHGLIGPNGSGKTTALNVVSGLIKADGGQVWLGERAIGGLRPHRLARLGLARTFQNLRLFRELTVLQNIQIGQHPWLRPSLIGSLLGLPICHRAEEAAAQEALDLGQRLSLGLWLDRPVADLPHGLQRRVELARALAARPRLLLLDEPAAGLSATEIRALGAIVRQARAAGIGVLLVEHHLELVLELCDTVTVLDRGRVIASGSPADVRANPRVIAAYLGRAGTANGGEPVESIPA